MEALPCAVAPGPLQTELAQPSFRTRCRVQYSAQFCCCLLLHFGNLKGNPNGSKWYEHYHVTSALRYSAIDERTVVEASSRFALVTTILYLQHSIAIISLIVTCQRSLPHI